MSSYLTTNIENDILKTIKNEEIWIIASLVSEVGIYYESLPVVQKVHGRLLW
jgi:hypothetical protein